jgi:small subunit ribosomal protein S3
LGRKVHPLGFRLGVIHDWQAKWYADTRYAETLREDLKLRGAIQTKYADAAISLVEIDHQAKEIAVTIHTARPGIVIGRGGQRVDELSNYLEKLIGKRVRLNIQEIRQPELDAYLVARTIAEQIQRRIAYRRAMKQAIFRTMQAGAKGIRVNCAGRLGDAEIARRQTMHDGQVPLQTLRADIDYGFTEARTGMGRIGVKVWINKGEILPEPREPEVEEMPTEMAAEAEPAAVEPIIEEAAEPVAAEATEAAAEAIPEAEPEKAAEPVAAETTEATAQEKPAGAPAKPAARRKKAEATEPEKAAEPAAPETREATAQEKPAKPAARRKKAEAVEPEKAAEPAAPVTIEATAEAKPAKPAARRKKTEAAESAETTTEAKAEEKPARKRSRKAATEETAAETPAVTEPTMTEKEG